MLISIKPGEEISIHLEGKDSHVEIKLTEDDVEVVVDAPRVNIPDQRTRKHQGTRFNKPKGVSNANHT